MTSPDPAPPLVEFPNPTPPPRWLRLGWYGLGVAALAVAVAWAHHVVQEYSTEEQRALVPVSTVWGLHVCLILGLTGLSVLAVPLARWFGRRCLLTGLGLAVLAYVACGLAPQVNRIFYDEHIYMQIGQSIARTGRAEYATYARAEYGEFTAYGAWTNKQPNGHPYFLSWVYRVAGVSEEASFVSMRVLTALSAAMLYFALVLAPFSLPRGTPVAVALCFTFTPLVLWWGRTVAVEPSTAATTIACFLATCIHARWRDPATGEGSPLTAVLLATSAALAAYFRPESLLVYPVAANLLWAADRRFLEDRSTWAALALSFALVIPHLLHLWSVRTEDWGATDGRRFDFAFVSANLASNAGYFVQQKWFPLAGSLLALAGAGWVAVRSRWLGLSLGLWFIISWGIFVLFYAGGYYYGASSRYAVVSAAPVALFMGIGAAAAIATLRRRPLLLGLLGTATVLNWAAAMHFVPTLGLESNQARGDIAFSREAAAQLPSGSLVISTDPCIWNVLGRNSARIEAIEGTARSDMPDLVRQYPGGIYLHWDHWANAENRFAEVWRRLIVDTHATVFCRGSAEAYKFALFRLDTPYARATFRSNARTDGTRIDMDAVAAAALAAEAAPPAPDQAPDAPAPNAQEDPPR